MMHSESSSSPATPHLESLYRTAYRMVHDRSAAEHCVERTYVDAGRQDDRLTLFTTLFRVLHNYRRPWLTLKRRQPAAHDELLRALDTVPSEYREVLLLADVEGFNRSEIQAILGIAAETAADRLREGRSRLRSELQIAEAAVA